MNNQRQHHWKKPLPLKNPSTPRLPRIGLMDRPFECALTNAVAPSTSKKTSPSTNPKHESNIKKSDSNDSGIESSCSQYKKGLKGKALFQSATMLLACYIRINKLIMSQITIIKENENIDLND
ncbi:uncharacterized protein TNIN_100021 [Trichonephila inaurata madagascariensis]|uniref:Uncharacterized protein n=1 Tax=Trichonephila inaurata madagascariensis TaxID=2747483 RepID=A0A8X7BYF3_9ARAC|nr:uncharacterized protein TNIN_100021 [Trichonephila inaurata madagascariensis]